MVQPGSSGVPESRSSGGWQPATATSWPASWTSNSTPRRRTLPVIGSSPTIVSISPNFKVTYTSFSPGNPYWRVHLKEQSFNVFLNRVYAVAVAGNEPIDDFKFGN